MPNPIIPSRVKFVKAFTLIELLIAIVIIGILAGIILTVINPAAMRDRARDGTIIATGNKIVSVINAFHSATGVYPTCAQLVDELSNATAQVQCTGTNNGTIAISGITMPQACGTNGYSAGSSVCGFRYIRTSGTTACLGIRLHRPNDLDGNGSTNQFFLWTSANGRVIDEGPTGSCT